MTIALGQRKGGPLRSLSRITGIAAATAAVILTLPLTASADPAEIYMNDACSPSFNVALGDPTICNRQGGTPFGVLHPAVDAEQVRWSVELLGAIRAAQGGQFTHC